MSTSIPSTSQTDANRQRVYSSEQPQEQQGGFMSRIATFLRDRGYDESWAVGRVSQAARNVVQRLGGLGPVVERAATEARNPRNAENAQRLREEAQAWREMASDPSTRESIQRVVTDTAANALNVGAQTMAPRLKEIAEQAIKGVAQPALNQINAQIFGNTTLEGEESSDESNTDPLDREVKVLMQNINGVKKLVDKALSAAKKLVEVANKTFAWIGEHLEKVPVIGKPLVQLGRVLSGSVTKLITGVLDRLGKIFNWMKTKGEEGYEKLKPLAGRLRNLDIQAGIARIQEMLARDNVTPQQA